MKDSDRGEAQVSNENCEISLLMEGRRVREILNNEERVKNSTVQVIT